MTERDLSAIGAAKLEGLRLADGWVVSKALPKKSSSGGTFSFFYEARNGDRVGFLKAIDFTEAFEPGTDTVSALKHLTAAFELERDIVVLCAERRMSKVAKAIAHGEVQVPNMSAMEGRVFYLIFEKADGDVRAQSDITNRLDTLWSLRAIRDVCLGLEQVHRLQVAHQDTKPSNVLHYPDRSFRITDFGRSSKKDRQVYHDDFEIAGDRTYAPPELLYGYTHNEFNVRRFGTDLYMLGNLVAFMFSGINVSADMFSRIDDDFHFAKWDGTYAEVLPYIQRAFSDTVTAIELAIDADIREHIVPLIRDLCNPDLTFRGHPRGVGTANQYSLMRYTSQLTNLTQKYEIQQRIKNKKTG